MNFYDIVEHIEQQHDFSLRTFGPGARTKGLIDHIKKELVEIGNAPTDLMEWVDVILLGIDGAWRAGHEPQQIAQALHDKLERNKARDWPDWKTANPDKAIEHVHIERPMSFTVQELRPEVLAFALLMEARLREKDEDKGMSYKSLTRTELEVHASVKMCAFAAPISEQTAARHAVDLANYAMMIADVAGALDEAVEIINGEPQH